ncbi:hypothetical protein GC169_06565 [bacterium]|nr:hypothetical protein [bacterium]
MTGSCALVRRGAIEIGKSAVSRPILLSCVLALTLAAQACGQPAATNEADAGAGAELAVTQESTPASERSGPLATETAASPSRTANAGGDWSGYTQIRLSDDAVQAITQAAPSSRMWPFDLVVFFGESGSYSAVVNNGHAMCTAWSNDDPNAASVSFGVTPDQYTGRPGWCYPFSLTSQRDGTVRLQAQNTVAASQNPHDERTRERSFDGGLEVVTRVRDLPTGIDGGPYARFDIRGIRLGPKPETGEWESIQYQPPRMEQYMFSQMQARVAGPGTARPLVQGVLAVGAGTGWPNDGLVTAFVREEGNTGLSRELEGLADSYVAKWGEPFYQIHAGEVAWRREDMRQVRSLGPAQAMVWVLEADGQPARPDSGTACVTAFQDFDWYDNISRGSSIPTQDIGPWGCGLIAQVFIGVAPTQSFYEAIQARDRDTTYAQASQGREEDLEIPLEGDVNLLREKLFAPRAHAAALFAGRIQRLDELRERHLIGAAPERASSGASSGASPAPAPAGSAPAGTSGDVFTLERLLGPEGPLRTGTKVEAAAWLEANGFPGPYYIREFDRSRVSIDGPKSMPRLGLQWTFFERTLDPARTPEAVVASLSRLIGAEPTCMRPPSDRGLVRCDWESPPGFPNVQTISLPGAYQKEVSAKAAEGQGYEYQMSIRMKPLE